MKIPHWIKAGYYFVLFESIFWFSGNKILKYIDCILGGYVCNYDLIQMLISLVTIIVSMLFFGLFVQETSLEIRGKH